MAEIVYIYALTDPRTNEIRYIGKTVQKPKDRLSSHVCPTRNKKTYCESWIKSLAKQGLRPTLVLIDRASDSNWQYWERYYIDYYKKAGANLTNHTLGGDNHNLGRRWKVRDSSRMGRKPVAQKKKRKNKTSRIQNREVIVKDKAGNFIGSFRNAKEAGKYLNICNSTIGKNIKGKYKNLKYIFEYGSLP